VNDLKNYYIKNEKKILGFITASLLLVAILNIYFVIEVNSSSNDECLWIQHISKEKKEEIIFNRVKVDGVAWQAGIRDGDGFVEIEGHKIVDVLVAQRILNKFESGDTVKYVIEKEGKLIPTYVRLKKVFNLGAFAFSLLGLIWLSIGFIVLVSKPGGRVQHLFYLIGAALVVMQSSNLITDFNNFIQINPLTILIDVMWMLGASFLPFLLIEFFWLFPQPFKLMNKKWVKRSFVILPILIFAVGIVIRAVLVYLIYARKVNDFNQIIYANVNLIFYNNLTGVAFLIGLVSLIINYRRLDKESRKPYLIILFSYIIGLAGVYYTAFLAPVIADTVFNSPELYTPIILIILIPISFTYSIFKYKLMDITVFVKNAVTYGAATLTVAAIYFIVIYLLGQSISSAISTEYQGIIAGLMFVAFALIFQSTKDRFQDFLTRKFYPEQFIHQKVLMKFSNEVSTVVGLNNILDSMHKTFVEALKINTFGIFLKEERSSDFKLLRATGISIEKCEIKNSQIFSFVIQKQMDGTNIVIERVDFENVFPDQVDILVQEEIYTIIPMLIKGKVIGLLLFGLKFSGSQFAGKDLDLLCASANQAAIALENARLYKSEAEKLKLDREIDLAQQIQQSLLPKCIPEIGGLDICGDMFPAMQIGGDYYDLIPFSNSKLFVIVGDVSGKGLSAALYMAKIQTMVQVICKDYKSPKDILVEINKKLYLSFEHHWFVTMIVALFDLETQTVTVCRAGHVPLIKAKNGSVEILRDGGLGVGLEKGEIFGRTLKEYQLPLIPGDIYAFYSDGITEAMNEKEEFFGEEKLCEIMSRKLESPSTEIMNELWKNLKTFRGSAEQNDDMTMVLVKMK